MFNLRISLFLALYSQAHALQPASQIQRGQESRFHPDSINVRAWDLQQSPNVNDTSNLIFATASSFLQHWPNTRYRNGVYFASPQLLGRLITDQLGHSIVLGTVPPGTLLYHGSRDNNVPTLPEWMATDPEHSTVFCRGLPEKGCWHLTMVATRPLKVLYFDGSSAAKMNSGTMDTQDILTWHSIQPHKFLLEGQRINALCEWGRKFGVDGFVRMEMDLYVYLPWERFIISQLD
jgi:hypothetical protein